MESVGGSKPDTESTMYARPDLSRRMPEADGPPEGVDKGASFFFLSRSSRALARLVRTSSLFPSIAPPFSQQSLPRWPFGCGQTGFEQIFVERPEFWIRRCPV